MLIYLIRNLLNGKAYVGQTVKTVEERWRRHCWPCSSQTNMPIVLALQKYGKKNFSVSVIDTATSQEELNQKEKWWAHQLSTFSPTGYNLRAGGGRGALSEETKRRISSSNRGRIVSAETRRRLSDSHLGHVHSDETKRRMSEYWKGRAPSPAARERSVEHNQKTYDLLRPDGQRVRVVNMKEFCLQQKLCRFKMCEVVRGKRRQHKGWRKG